MTKEPPAAGSKHRDRHETKPIHKKRARANSEKIPLSADEEKHSSEPDWQQRILDEKEEAFRRSIENGWVPS